MEGVTMTKMVAALGNGMTTQQLNAARALIRKEDQP
jgi:hypothetical protein